MTQPILPRKSARPSAGAAWPDSSPTSPRNAREAAADFLYECYLVIGLLVLGMALLRIILR